MQGLLPHDGPLPGMESKFVNALIVSQFSAVNSCCCQMATWQQEKLDTSCIYSELQLRCWRIPPTSVTAFFSTFLFYCEVAKLRSRHHTVRSYLRSYPASVVDVRPIR